MRTVLLLALLSASLSAAAQTPAYLREMPPVDRVLRDMQATDPDETAARQMGTFLQFNYLIETMAGSRRYRNQMTPDEQRLITDYTNASTKIMQSKPEYRRPQALKGYDIDPRFREELLNKYFSPSFRAFYQQVDQAFNARHQQFQQAEQQAYQQQKAAAAANSSATPGGVPPTTDPGTLAMRRCAESGRSLTDCLGEAFSTSARGIAPGLAFKQPPAGLILSGEFVAANASILFQPRSSALPTDVARFKCGKLEPERYPYKLTNTGHGLAVTIASTPPVELALRPGNTFAGPASIELPGRVISGYGPPHTVSYKVTDSNNLVADSTFNPSTGASDRGGYHYESTPSYTAGYHYEEKSHTTSGTVRDPIYSPARDRCSLASLSAGAGVVQGANAASAAAGALTMIASGTPPAPAKQPILPAGLRLTGTYAGPSGLSITFRPDSATVTCNEIGVADTYTVESAAQVLVHLNNASHPFTLVLRPDGSFVPTAPGSITVSGRTLTGTNGSGQPTFAPRTVTCSLAPLAPQ